MVSYLCMSLLFVLSCLVSDTVAYYSYSSVNEYGPNSWYKKWKQCGGEQQSPVDFEELEAEDITLPQLKFRGFRGEQKAQIINTGYTIKLDFVEKDNAPEIRSGPLPCGIYGFYDITFRWGETDTSGSEHSILNHSYAMEMQMTFLNKNYQDFETALGKENGIAIVAYFFTVRDEPNKKWRSFFNTLSSVKQPNQEAILPEPISLKTLMLFNSEEYFTYNGSLTYPPCKEAVTWIVFQDPIIIGHSQMSRMRNLMDLFGYLITNNRRPIQPGNGRRVRHRQMPEPCKS